MPRLEPGTSRLSMLSECTYHLRYFPVALRAHMHRCQYLASVLCLHGVTYMLIYSKLFIEADNFEAQI